MHGERNEYYHNTRLESRSTEVTQRETVARVCVVTS
jgi:hypothetical protein